MSKQMRTSYHKRIEKATLVVVGSEPEENHAAKKREGSEEDEVEEREEGEEADVEEEGSEEEGNEGEQADAEEEDDTERYDTSDSGPKGVKVKRSSPSKGASTVVEAKVMIGHNLSQLVRTCVVSSFMENSLYPHLETMVPTILIGLLKYQVCLYCCKHDLLLILCGVYIAAEAKTSRQAVISRTAMLFLWVVINHRRFLNPKALQYLPDPANRWKSTIIER